ncbi:uncharacterized protein N7518_004962 [Penicillium psychrosexuale]|uniref:uncharacterized protein n=1 Tax=Penicillium psychrosexuale TaxID=1002107 RepID=UPI002545759D|nr:uncharacterized protein N7518_004962 [Penicillium psychrosexuale]KAJ5796422.1 hypothetical protein N7518_004962 [Penicillium psychrosexuale]
MSIKVFILVYSGDPLDYTKFRHTALHFEFPNGSTCAMHIVGSPGIFRFQPKDDYNPEQSRQLVCRIPVAHLQDWITEDTVRGLITRTPVKNGEMDWNCQNWVGDALARMVSSGYLTAAQRASAIDLMTDACLEAQDE